MCIKRHIHEKKRNKQIITNNLRESIERLEKMSNTENEAGRRWRAEYIENLKLDIIVKTNAFDSCLSSYTLKYDILVRAIFHMVDEVEQFEFPTEAGGLQGV